MAIFNDTQTDTLLKVFPELSVTEARIFILYSSGVPAKEIAEKSNISVKTVNSHINNTQKKYEVSSYFELRTVFMCRSYLVIIKALDGFEGLSEFFPGFNDNEIGVLELYAIGHSYRSISNRLNIELCVVTECMDSVRYKLSLHNDENLRAAFCYIISLYSMRVWGLNICSMQ